MSRSSCAAVVRHHKFLKLLNPRHHRFAGGMFEHAPQVSDTGCPLRVGKPTRGEHTGNLRIQFGAVRNDDDGRLLLCLVAPQLQRQPQHRQAFAQPLRMPDDAAAPAALPRRANAPHGLVDGHELLVADELANGASAFDCKDDEVVQDVQQVARLEQPVEQDVLCRRRPVLPSDDPLIAVWLIEVQEPNAAAFSPAAPVLFQRDAVDERCVDLLIGLGKTGGGNLGDPPHRLGDIGFGQPGIQALEGGGEAAGEDGLLEARSFAFKGFGRDVGVAERLQ